MARVSNDTFFNRAFVDFRRSQSDIATYQAQIGSGKKLLKPSDDPSAAAQVLDLNETLARIEQYGRNAVLANERLSMEESTLDGVGGLLIRVKELALAASSGTQTRETRQAYGAEVKERLDELLDFGNVQDANGDYLFGGFRAQTRPFERLGSGFSYNGGQGVRDLQVSATRRVSTGDSGDRVFMRVPGGNGRFSVSASGSNTGTAVIKAGSVTDPAAFTSHAYSIRFTSAATFDVVDDTLGVTVAAAQAFAAGSSIQFDGIETSIAATPAAGDRFDITPSPAQSMFSTLQTFIDTMALNPDTPAEQAQLAQAMNGVIDSLDQALSHVLEVRTTVGARRNALESVEIEAENLQFELASTVSSLQDVNMESAISKMQQQITALEASQATFVRLAGLSLFNFLR